MARRPFETYFTGRRSDVAALVEQIELSPAARILEPCAGAGHIAAELPGTVYRNDLVGARPARRLQGRTARLDATMPEAWALFPAVDWVITNPPFSAAARILPLAYAHARQGVAFMLRLTFLEPCEDRGAWLAEHPLTGMIVLPRFSFDGSGSTDSVTTAWMIWEKKARPAVYVLPRGRR